MSGPAMDKSATVAYGVHDLIAERWSSVAFADRPLEAPLLGSLLEAARWAPSSYNAQPWRFLVGTRDDAAGFARLADCLVQGNAWAKAAPVLLLSVAQLDLEHNGAPNRHAWHDVGLATENLVLQACALGLVTHQLGGFDPARARASLSIPSGFEPVTMIAVGHPGDADALSEALAHRERRARERKPLAAIAFGSGWETELGPLAGS